MKSLSLLALITISSCKVFDCESEKVGTTKLLEKSSTFIPYKNGDKVIFVSNKNNSTTFIVERLDQVPTICTKVLCKAFNDPFGNPPCEFFETEAISANLKTEDLSMVVSISVNVDLLQADSELFFDALAASYNKETTFVEGRYGLEPHFTKPTFDRDALAFAAPMTLKDEVLLNGMVYKEVYISGKAPNQLYIQNNKGIIGYELNGEVFTQK